MIDLHFHILPALDDGPADMQGSLQLARAAQHDGVEIVAATPHLREDHRDVRPEDLAGRCARLNEAIAAAGIALEVVPGGELDVLWVRDATREQLRLASYGQGGTDVLLETPSGPLGPSFEVAIGRLWSFGYRVLLAHPERSRTLQQSPGRLTALVSQGLLVQVTAGALIAAGGRSRSREFAQWLIRHGVAQVLASDAHSATDFRPPNLAAGLAAASAIDPARARWMVVDAPLAVLAGRPLGAVTA
jgi:protein-tyrosine phosphatase